MTTTTKQTDNYGPAPQPYEVGPGYIRFEMLIDLRNRYGAQTPFGEVWEWSKERLLSKLRFIFGVAEQVGCRLVK